MTSRLGTYACGQPAAGELRARPAGERVRVCDGHRAAGEAMLPGARWTRYVVPGHPDADTLDAASIRLRFVDGRVWELVDGRHVIVVATGRGVAREDVDGAQTWATAELQTRGINVIGWSTLVQPSGAPQHVPLGVAGS